METPLSSCCKYFQCRDVLSGRQSWQQEAGEAAPETLLRGEQAYDSEAGVNQVIEDGWFVRNAAVLKTVFRIVFGVIWGVDGALKFDSALVAAFPDMISEAARGQPAWLQGWFLFWHGVSAAQPALWVYGTGILEEALAFALVFGFMRKSAYVGGFILSLFIWAVPEGFGGPYGPASTDIGTGIVYALVFLLFMVMNATYGASRYSLDVLLERRWPGWARVAEFRGAQRGKQPSGREQRPVHPGNSERVSR